MESPSSINLSTQTNILLIQEAKWCNLGAQGLHRVKSFAVIILQRELTAAVILTPLLPKCAGVVWHRIHWFYIQGANGALLILYRDCTQASFMLSWCCKDGWSWRQLLPLQLFTQCLLVWFGANKTFLCLFKPGLYWTEMKYFSSVSLSWNLGQKQL